MYAIVETDPYPPHIEYAADQLTLVDGGTTKVETPVGGTVELDSVLLVQGSSGLSVGRPRVEGAKVVAEVVKQGREDKIVIFKKKRRKRFQKRAGHRQPLTEIRVKEILSA